MREEVCRELVVVPHESVLYVVLDSVYAYLRKLLVHYVAVERPYEGIDAEGFKGGEPRMLFGVRSEE